MLRRARDAAGLTQEELAAQAGLTANAISALERGERRFPYPATVRALAEALGLSADHRRALVQAVPRRGERSHELATPAPSLPAPLASLIGRERELATVAELLVRADVRLVTLTGSGGVGKTRLALQVASDLVAWFPEGMTVVSLASVRDTALVASAIARALGIAESAERAPLGRVGADLRDRRGLLVLDNFEHLLAAAPVVTALLVQCPRLKVLATSRSPLRLDGEHDLPVMPLQVPDARHHTLAELAGSPAVRLFAERARATNPAFALTGANAAAVGAICQRLDGLPLAIELAAARSNLFEPAALLPRLAHRLPLLTGGRRDSPDRHRTLRDAIAWSHDLLSADEQVLFRRLAVFVDGFTLEAAEAVAAPAGDRPREAVAGVAALVDQSLLHVDPGSGDAPRCRMLETVREFGLEQLAAAGELEATLAAHAAYYGTLDERLDPNHLEFGGLVDDRLRRIEADHPNLLAALDWMEANGDTEGVLRLAGSLGTFWHHRGYVREGRRWLEWALEHTADVPTRWRGRALGALCMVLFTEGDLDRAAQTAEAALAMSTRIGEPELTALAYHMLGLIEASLGRFNRAEAFMEDVRDRNRAFGMPTLEAMALIALSNIAYRCGDAETGARRAEDALAICRATGHAGGAALAIEKLARHARDQGDDHRAASLYREALALWAGIGERWLIVRGLAGLASIASGHGQPEHAATLVGTADGRLRESGGGAAADTRQQLDGVARSARGALGEERFAELFAAGGTLPMGKVLAVAADISVPQPSGRATNDRVEAGSAERRKNPPYSDTLGHRPKFGAT